MNVLLGDRCLKLEKINQMAFESNQSCYVMAFSNEGIYLYLFLIKGFIFKVYQQTAVPHSAHDMSFLIFCLLIFFS